MPIAKKILITTDSQETVIIRRARAEAVFAYCDDCLSEAQFMTFDEAVDAAPMRATDLIRLINCEQLHLRETSHGHLLICTRSLDESLGQKRSTP